MLIIGFFDANPLENQYNSGGGGWETIWGEFGPTPSCVQSLILTVHSKVTPGSTQGTIIGAGCQIRISHMQGKSHNSCTISTVHGQVTFAFLTMIG